MKGKEGAERVSGRLRRMNQREEEGLEGGRGSREKI